MEKERRIFAKIHTLVLSGNVVVVMEENQIVGQNIKGIEEKPGVLRVIDTTNDIDKFEVRGKNVTISGAGNKIDSTSSIRVTTYGRKAFSLTGKIYVQEPTRTLEISKNSVIVDGKIVKSDEIISKKNETISLFIRGKRLITTIQSEGNASLTCNSLELFNHEKVLLNTAGNGSISLMHSDLFDESFEASDIWEAEIENLTIYGTGESKVNGKGIWIDHLEIISTGNATMIKNFVAQSSVDVQITGNGTVKVKKMEDTIITEKTTGLGRLKIKY